MGEYSKNFVTRTLLAEMLNDPPQQLIFVCPTIGSMSLRAKETPIVPGAPVVGGRGEVAAGVVMLRPFGKKLNSTF